MLRKRTRSHQRDQQMNNLTPDSMSETYFHSDMSTQNHKNNSFTKAPGLFVGFNPKNSESDSVRSPTSPLDFRIFSSLGNPFRSPKTQNEGYLKSWDCSKVGLSIIDSLDNKTKQTGEVNRPSENKNILFGRQVSIHCPDFCSHEKPKSLPKDVAVFSKPANVRKGNSNVVFEIGGAPFEPEPNGTFRSCSMDDSRRYGSYLTNFGNRKSRFGSGNLVSENVTNLTPLESRFVQGSLDLGNFSGPISASEIELSEDYTCVRTHGPNPKVTHIYGDRILECRKDEITEFFVKSEDDNAIVSDISGGQYEVLASYPLDDFLKFCYSCHKKLDGEDIYMYRGEKAFCSYGCRSLEIEIDEKMERINTGSSETSDSCEEVSGSSLFITTA